MDNLNVVKTDDAITRRSNYINELKEIEFDIRKVSHDLNTDFVSNSSFSDIINTLVETQCEAYGLAHSIAITKSINWDLVSNKTKVHIYRITQESLQNIYKHAEASLVSITINEDNNSLSLTISDNGKGFENEKVKDGIGLKNIKSRVEEINATFHLKTIKNQGTTVEIEIPVK
ncbi:sensor histidine kinase [Lacinutrix neustonica]|uniref:sensor histidine kinase n=1 Tax=Lacinutrix neustonica TaxID=2980107 RepID=UPI0028BDABD4|nr:ATP-binding protein [Lacinutrix neustonica]